MESRYHRYRTDLPAARSINLRACEGLPRYGSGTTMTCLGQSMAERADLGISMAVFHMSVLVYCVQVQELLQQVSGLSNKTVMQDTCRALLAQRPDDTVSTHLQTALTLAGVL